MSIFFHVISRERWKNGASTTKVCTKSFPLCASFIKKAAVLAALSLRFSIKIGN